MDDETRVNRYKEYRQSFIKEGSIVLNDSDESQLDVNATSSTLPIEEVIKSVQEDEMKVAFANNARRNRILKIAFKVAIAVIVIAGLVVLGYFAWRN